MGKRRLVSFATLLMLTAAAYQVLSQSGGGAKPAAVPMATYHDLDGDVWFQYPAAWKIDDTQQFYAPTFILMGDRKARVQVVFYPEGNSYERTTLLGLAFAYVKVPQPSSESCAAMAARDAPDKLETVTIHGAPFEHTESEVAGMCHEAKQEIYRTYRNGSCYLFEGDMDTICSGVADGQRDLTAAETRALMGQLNAIPQSIRFAATK
jgi:hypothetical protein